MPKRVMIINDSGSVRKVLMSVLQDAGFEVLESEDGQDAIEKLAEWTPDLILCDIFMPRMNGIKFVEEFRKEPSNRKIPVLMLTTEDREDRKLELMEAGANGWITKPFRPDQLLAVISKILSKNA